MRKFLLLLVFFFALTTILEAQPSIQWKKCLGGSSPEEASSIQQTSDGGFIVAGVSFSNDGDVSGNHGGPNYWIVKLTSSGIIQWQKSLGGSGGDFASSIQQTSDGGYIVAGRSHSIDGDVSGNHGGGDCWIVKLNSLGAIQWQKSLGGSRFDEAASIKQTKDGGYIVAGTSFSNDGNVSGHHGDSLQSDYWVVKLTTSGTIQWQESLGGSLGDGAGSIQQTSDGGYIVVGTTSSNDGDVSGNHGVYDAWIIKLDSSSVIQWQHALGGARSEEALSIQQTNDGGYIVAGWSQSNDGDVSGNHGSYDYWIVKLTSKGTIEWQKSLGGSGDDKASSIQQTSDDGYIVTGITGSNDGDVKGNHGDHDYWLVKLNFLGATQWQESLGGSNFDYAKSIKQTSDGGYIVAGYSYSNDGDVTGNHGDGTDYWIVKLSSVSSVEDEVLHLQPMMEQNYPNPVTTTTRINFSLTKSNSSSAQFEVCDILGRVVYSSHVDPSQGEILFDASALANGVYLYSLSNAGNVESKMMIVQK